LQYFCNKLLLWRFELLLQFIIFFPITTMTIIRHNAVLLIITFASVYSFAQETKVDSGGCNTDFAKFLVDQQVAESRSVAETDKRIRILTRSADFLWKFDQPTAREYFTEAFKVANDRFNEKGFEKKTEKGLIISAPDYRFEVIRAIAKKDAPWAKRLIEQLLKEYEKTAAERNFFDKSREIDAILYIAQESVKTNPDLSWYLFRRIMRQPLDFYWYWVPFGVAATDQQFANALYRELLAAYPKETPRRLLFLSAYPFGNERVFGLDKYGFGTSVPKTFAPDTGLQRQFIDVFFRRISTYTSDPENLNRPPEANRHPEPLYMVTALHEIEPIIIQQFPDLLQRHSVARAQATALLNDEMRKDLSEKEKWNESLGLSFEDRLKLVEKADEEGKLKDSMIFSLITWGIKTEEQFRQIEPWLDKIKDETAKKETTNYFWFLRSHLAIKEQRLEDAQKFAAKVPEIDHRAILLFEIVELKLKDVNDAASVHQMLSDMGRVARQMENSVAKARVLLGLANLYEKVNHVFALDELSDAVKVVNRLENPDMLSTSLRRQITGKDFSFYAGFSMPGYDLEGTFKNISKNDFEMSLSNAKALEDKYFRTLAVLAIAQNCIDKPKPKSGRKTPAAGK
jgi:hypothetical protein